MSCVGPRTPTVTTREASRALAREKRRRAKRAARALAEAKRLFAELEAGKTHARGGFVLRRDGTRRREPRCPNQQRTADEAALLHQDRP